MARSYLSRALSGYRGINALLKILCPVTLAAAPVNATAAVLATALAGNNNDIDYTAVRKGVYGNGITIRYVDPGVETATESVAVVGKAITVTLRSVSSVLSTATQVRTALTASAAASALITHALHAGNDGSGAVIALAATNLATGVDGTEAEPYQQGTYGGYMYVNVTDTRQVPGGVDTWYKYQLTLA